MVQIEQKLAEYDAAEKNCAKLIDIARSMCNEYSTRQVFKLTPYSFAIDQLRVDILHRDIMITSPQYLDLAMKLAQAYEAETKTELTIRKDY